jgi:hypothetical protein
MAFVSPATWRAWKSLCSVAGCEPEQRAELYSVFCENLRIGLSKRKSTIPTDHSNQDLALLADSYFKPGLEETGPRSKDAIFSRFAHLESDDAKWASCATAYVRMVLINPNSAAAFLSKRHGRSGPIDQTVSAHDAIAEAFLDPDVAPDALASATDVAELGEKLAAGFFVTLDGRQKTVLWAISENLSVNDPRAIALAGCGTQTMYNTQNALSHWLQAKLAQTFATQAPEEIGFLALAVAKAMLPLAKDWGNLENRATKSS